MHHTTNTCVHACTTNAPKFVNAHFTHRITHYDSRCQMQVVITTLCCYTNYLHLWACCLYLSTLIKTLFSLLQFQVSIIHALIHKDVTSVSNMNTSCRTVFSPWIVPSFVWTWTDLEYNVCCDCKVQSWNDSCHCTCHTRRQKESGKQQSSFPYVVLSLSGVQYLVLNPPLHNLPPLRMILSDVLPIFHIYSR